MVVGVAESGLISLKKRKPEEEEAGVAATEAVLFLETKKF